MNSDTLDYLAGPVGLKKTKMVDATLVGGPRDGHTVPIWDGIISLHIDSYEYRRRDGGSYVFVSGAGGLSRMNNRHDGYESEELLLAAMARRGEVPGVPLTDEQAHARGLPYRVNGEFAKALRAQHRGSVSESP